MTNAERLFMQPFNHPPREPTPLAFPPQGTRRNGNGNLHPSNQSPVLVARLRRDTLRRVLRLWRDSTGRGNRQCLTTPPPPQGKEIPTMATKSKRSLQGTQSNTLAQRERAITRAKRTKKPVLLAYWFEGWQGHERRINLYAMPDGTTQERVANA